MQNIDGKVVVITAASSGLGAATARMLVAHGAQVVLGARRADRLRAFADELRLDPGDAIPTEMADAAQVKHLVDQAVVRHGRIDVDVNEIVFRPTAQAM